MSRDMILALCVLSTLLLSILAPLSLSSVTQASSATGTRHLLSYLTYIGNIGQTTGTVIYTVGNETYYVLTSTSGSYDIYTGDSLGGIVAYPGFPSAFKIDKFYHQRFYAVPGYGAVDLVDTKLNKITRLRSVSNRMYEAYTIEYNYTLAITLSTNPSYNLVFMDIYNPFTKTILQSREYSINGTKARLLSLEWLNKTHAIAIVEDIPTKKTFRWIFDPNNITDNIEYIGTMDKKFASISTILYYNYSDAYYYIMDVVENKSYRLFMATDSSSFIARNNTYYGIVEKNDGTLWLAEVGEKSYNLTEINYPPPYMMRVVNIEYNDTMYLVYYSTDYYLTIIDLSSHQIVDRVYYQIGNPVYLISDNTIDGHWYVVLQGRPSQYYLSAAIFEFSYNPPTKMQIYFSPDKPAVYTPYKVHVDLTLLNDTPVSNQPIELYRLVNDKWVFVGVNNTDENGHTVFTVYSNVSGPITYKAVYNGSDTYMGSQVIGTIRVYYVLNMEIVGNKKLYARIPEYYTVHVTDPLGYGVAGVPVVVLVSNDTMEYIGGAGYTDSYGIAYVIVTPLFSGNYTLMPSTLMKYTIINSTSIDVEVKRIDTIVPASVNTSLSNIYLALTDLNKTVGEGFTNISGDLGELRNVLLVLNSKLDNIGNDLSTIISIILDLSSEIDILNTSISNGFLIIETKLDVISGDVNKTYTLLFRVNNSLTNIFSQLDILKLDHDNIDSNLDIITSMLANISSLSNEISELRDTLSSITSDLEAVVESMEEYHGLLIGVNENLTLLLGLIEDMDTLKQVVDEIKETTTEMNMSIGPSVTRIETNTATILAKTSDILKDIEILDNGQVRIETSIGEIKGEIKEVKNNITIIKTSLGELKIDLKNAKQDVIQKLEELGYIKTTTPTTKEQGIAPELIYTVLAVVVIAISITYSILTKKR